MTGTALAQRLKMHPARISSLELGTGDVRLSTIARVASALGVTVNQLLTDDC